MLGRRYKTDKSQLRYKLLTRRHGTFYVDFLKIGSTSVRQFIGGTLYTNRTGFKKFFPCTSETGAQTAHTLRSFIELVGLPTSLHSDNHRNFKEGFLKRLLRKFGIYCTYTKPHSPWQNRAEPAIGEVKRYARRLMSTARTPVRLWCFCFEYAVGVLSLCVAGRFELQGRTPYETVLNYTLDISEYVSYSWFQWFYYFDEGQKTKSLCRWLGPTNGVSQSFCSYILLENGSFIARSSVLAIPDSDLNASELQQQMKQFMTKVETKIGNSKQPVYDRANPNKIYYDLFMDDYDDVSVVLPYGDEL